MQQYADVVLDPKGNVIKAASVRVLLLDNTLATIYSANGGTPTSNPLTTDTLGRFAFYAANGDYKLEISVAGTVITTVGPVTLFDVDDAGLATLSDLQAQATATFVGGTTTAAIQAVLDTLPARVVVRAGVRNLAAPLVIKNSDIELVFEPGAKLVAAASMSAMIYSEDKHRVTIVPPEMDGAGLAETCIHSRCVAASVEDFRVEDGGKLYGTATDAVSLSKAAILVDSLAGEGGAFRHKRVRIVRPVIGTCGTHGALAAYADDVHFLLARIDGAANHGFEAVGCTDVTVAFCQVDNCGLSALGVGSKTRGFLIAFNRGKNNGGDGTITVEHNSVQGAVYKNDFKDCRTVGINISWADESLAGEPHNKCQDVDVIDNVLWAKAGVVTFQAINAYSGDGAARGKRLTVRGNKSRGFNGGAVITRFDHVDYLDNRADDLKGANTYVAKFAAVSFATTGNNSTDTDTGDHAIQIIADDGGTHCDRISVRGGYIFAAGSGAKACIKIDGTGIHHVSGIGTNGALHHVLMTGASSCQAGGNWGNLAGASVSGGTLTPW
jgi:hypothetical protein